jgi:hypothetical protein
MLSSHSFPLKLNEPVTLPNNFRDVRGVCGETNKRIREPVGRRRRIGMGVGDDKGRRIRRRRRRRRKLSIMKREGVEGERNEKFFHANQ